jgi:hypothetical protein|tara:strand:+ start:745 stop:939 length:195 start_codon:yes stop_codon:yes gene_type:complete
MRIVIENYGDACIYQERPFGYKRFIVEFKDGSSKVYSSLWYKIDQVKKFTLKEIDMAELGETLK